MKRGKYIILDGIEAVGKDGLQERIICYLKSQGIEVEGSVRDPGGTQIGEMDRAILKEPVLAYNALRAVFKDIKGSDFSSEANADELINRDPWVEIYELLSSRTSSVKRKVLPALAEGRWAIVNRAWTTTFAYQGFGRLNGNAEDLELIELNHRKILGEAYPGDRIYVIDITVEESFKRIRADSRGRTRTDLFDNLDSEFFERVRKGFIALKERYPREVIIINGMRSQEEILTESILPDLEGMLKAGGRI